MALVCTKIQEWVEEEVSKPVEEWEESQEKKCKKRKWYDPRGWFCWFITILVKVIRWVVVTVGKWVIRTVCKIIALVVVLVIDVFAGLWDIIAGLFTLDWRRILDGFIRIIVGALKGVFGLLRIILLGDTIDFIIDEVNKSRLRNYVRKLLEAKYSGETLQQIKDAIRLDLGAFGLRLRATAYRTVLDSEAKSKTDPTATNLVVLHESGAINLRELCGFEFNEGFWNRKRYKTLKKGIVVGGGGGGELDNPISENDLDSYLSSRGSSGPPFIVISMRDGVFDTKLDAAEDKGRQLGLMLSWEKTSVEITQAEHIKHKGFDTLQANSSLTTFLADVISRTRESGDADGAMAQLCTPVAIGVFRYTDTIRGLANTLRGSSCGLPVGDNSGVTFIDNKPDHFWKYVPIHELGHYFGLCHVDGIDRIMVSTREKSWWDWSVLPNLLYLKGEPYFTLDEAKTAWDYIVANFDARCLGAKPEIID
jgi:hypothetical protein